LYQEYSPTYHNTEGSTLHKILVRIYQKRDTNSEKSVVLVFQRVGTSVYSTKFTNEI